MNTDNRTGLLLLSGAIVFGILVGGFQMQKIAGEIKIISSDMKDLSISMNEVKASLAEKDTQAFKVDMQESGRKMISMDYAGKFTKWNAAKTEIDDLNKTLENAATMRPDLAKTIQDFRSIYIPKLMDAADEKDIKNFEAVWSDAYNACVACHKDSDVTPRTFNASREINNE